MNNMEDGKDVVCQGIDTITENYNNVLAFIQAVMVQLLRVVAVPLSLHVVKHSRD